MNPYQPPQFDAGHAGSVPDGDRQRLYEIAKAQRGINMVVLLYIGTGMLSRAIGGIPGAQILIGLIALGVIIAGAIYAIRMANSLWGTGAAVACAISLLIPCVGLLTLLVLNSRATVRLRAAGFKVGILGADPEEVRRQLGL
jgi:hypothetical protein